MKIRDIITENIFTCDYRLVMDAVASLYQEHYDVNIWSNAEAHDAAAQVLMKEHPSSEELEFIIDTQELPERFQELNFPLNDDILGITTGDAEFTEAAPPVANAPAAPAAKEPIVQATDDMEQRMLDRMGKRFGLPPGSSADEVQAAQQAHLDKNDPAAAAQYKKNMANIDAGGAQADNAPVKLAPKPGQPSGAPNPDAAGGQAAAKANKSPIAIMLAQPTIGKNQAMLDVIAPTVGLPVGSSAAEILAADDARNAKAGGKYAPATPATESMGGATDSKGRTQQEWLRLVKAKFPDAKIQQAKMIDGPIRAMLANGKTLNWSKAETVVDEEPASRALCTSGKPDSALGASQLSSCKSQGYRSRDGGKTHKVGADRIGVRGKKIKGKKYGGPLPDWS
jgi:hypothetical protein